MSNAPVTLARATSFESTPMTLVALLTSFLASVFACSTSCCASCCAATTSAGVATGGGFWWQPPQIPIITSAAAAGAGRIQSCGCTPVSQFEDRQAYPLCRGRLLVRGAQRPLL